MHLTRSNFWKMRNMLLKNAISENAVLDNAVSEKTVLENTSSGNMSQRSHITRIGCSFSGS